MKKVNLFFSLLFMGLLFVGCSSDDNGGNNPGTENPTGEELQPEEMEKYVVTATPLATEGVADYILTTDDLSSGSISTEGNGIEQDGTYRYYVTNNDKFFSLI